MNDRPEQDEPAIAPKEAKRTFGRVARGLCALSLCVVVALAALALARRDAMRGEPPIATNPEVAVVSDVFSESNDTDQYEDASTSDFALEPTSQKDFDGSSASETTSQAASFADTHLSGIKSNEPEVRQVALCAAAPTVEIQRARICDLRIGDRLPGANPEGNDGSDESVFASERHFVYTLRVPKSDGTFCTAKLLRPENWFEGQATQLRCALDGKVVNNVDVVLSEMLPLYSTQRFDLEVWLDLEELGCVGWSKAVEVDESFEYQPGVGNLVTGTFEHIAQELIDLQIEDQDKPIGCTATHPFWSDDRQAFVPAGELNEGERVLLFNGETKRVVQKLPRPGPETVYNLEVFGEHVYLVTNEGLLVHNHGCLDNSKCKYIVKEYGPSKVFKSLLNSDDVIAVGPYNNLRKHIDLLEIRGLHKDYIVQDKVNEFLERASKKDGISITISSDIHVKTSTYGRVSVGKSRTVSELIERDLAEIREKLIAQGKPVEMVDAAFDEVRRQNKMIGKLDVDLKELKIYFGLEE